MSDKKITKFYETEVKASDKDRTITITASKEVVDRDADIVKVSGINTKNYKKNPVVMMAHNYSQLPIGRAVGRKVWVEGNELKMKVEFAPEDINPMADLVYRMYKGGYMKGWSIGFLPNYEKIEYPEKHKQGARRIFNEVEMLEVSAAPVPANQAALGASIGKAFNDNVIDEVEMKSLEEWVQLEEEEDTTDDITKLQEELTEKDIKIAELKLQLKEQNIDEEIEESDSYLSELFEEFDPAASPKGADGEQMEENDLDSLFETTEDE